MYVHRIATVLTLLLTTACNAFSDQEEVSLPRTIGQLSTPGASGTRTTFDRRLPLAFEEIWSLCHPSGLWLTQSSTEIDLLGDCQSHEDLQSFEAQLLFGSLSPDRAVPIAIPEPLYAERLSYGIQVRLAGSITLLDCTVDMDTEISFSLLDLDELEVEWDTWLQRPVLRVSLGTLRRSFPAVPHVPAFRDTIAVARCPSRINDTIVQGVLDSAHVDGVYAVLMEDLDIDLLVELEIDANGRIVADVTSDVHVSGLDIQVDWERLGTTAPPEIANAFANAVEAIIAPRFQPFATEVASLLNAEIPDGETACEIYVDGRKLVIDASPTSQCLRSQGGLTPQHGGSGGGTLPPGDVHHLPSGQTADRGPTLPDGGASTLDRERPLPDGNGGSGGSGRI